jgi:hypothetical protein
MERGGCQGDASQRFAPSMRQRIDVAELYRRARKQLVAMRQDDRLPRPFPDDCPFSLDDLLEDDPQELEARLTAACA